MTDQEQFTAAVREYQEAIMANASAQVIAEKLAKLHEIREKFWGSE